jgi:hypothetical protein
MGSLNFATVISRSDFTFIVSSLSRYLRNPFHVYIAAANRIISYIYNIRFLSLEYDSCTLSEVFIYTSDTAFADNEDRRSSDGYLFQLFGGPIDWCAAKQHLVITLSTEAELHTLSQATKEIMW